MVYTDLCPQQEEAVRDTGQHEGKGNNYRATIHLARSPQTTCASFEITSFLNLGVTFLGVLGILGIHIPIFAKMKRSKVRTYDPPDQIHRQLYM